MEEYLEMGVKLAKQLANKYAKGNPTLYDDYLNAAYFGLAKALNKYDDSKNVKFTTYSWTCINNEILYYIRSEKKYSKNISINMPLNHHDNSCDEPLTYEDLFSNNDIIDNGLMYKELNELINKNIDKIFKTESQKRVFLIRKSGVLSQKEISKKVNLSQPQICKIVKQIDACIVIFLNKNGYNIKM